ncbi:exopolysaccharide biosynthesis protein [Maribius pontilimi]|uniref:Exopolysaccharide biosynthesis protein n=1 Tax=Palleronia pontilimi TaxID=1964209 RepID=A0A934IKY3_9RHOB|nr:exopolysaccharide biosynthesis protein [Palleronia pontilimi]MBJ3763904.1 exopolysaccharide biosynthesis protein [Palleronia pontilimi]
MTRITDILNDLDELAGSDDDVSVGEVQDKIGHRGSGVFLLVPGLIGMSPLGAIPSVPTIMGLVALLFSVQIVVGKSSPWLPAVLADRSIDDDRLARAVDKSRGAAGWLDRHFGGRLEALTGDPMVRVAALFCAALAVTAPFLGVVPFAAALPMAGIALFGLALTLRDGAAMLAALVFACGALYGAFTLTP